MKFSKGKSLASVVAMGAMATAVVPGIAGGSLLAASPVHAAAITEATGADVSNLATAWKNTLVNPKGGSYVGGITSIKVNSSFSLANGAKKGDYVKLTNGDNGKYFQFLAFQPVDVKDKDGAIIGTLVYTSTKEVKLILTDYVESHTNVAVNFDINEAIFEFGNPAEHEVGFTVGGSFIGTGETVKYLNVYARPHTIDVYQADKTTYYGLATRAATLITEFGVTRATLTADPGATWDCDRITSTPSGIVASQMGGTFGNPTYDKSITLPVRVISCTPETVVLETTTVEQPYKDNIFGFYNIPAMLTAESINNKATSFPGFSASMTFPSGKVDKLTTTQQTYNWTSASASGKLPPTATPDKATTPFDTPATLDVLANDKAGDYPLDASRLTLVDSTGKAATSVAVKGGTYTLTNNKVVFTPTKGFTGDAEAVSYRVYDTNGNYATSTAQVAVGEPASPTATPDEERTKYNKPVNSKVLSNDALGQPGSSWSKVELKDAQGNPVSTLTTEDGTYTVKEDNTIDFTPVAGFTGTAKAITYTATDSNGKSASSTLTIVVADAAAPTASPDENTTEFNTPISTAVLTNDKLTEDGATWSKVELKQADGTYSNTLTTEDGVYTVKDDNSVEFTPSKDFSGNAKAITYRATDSNGKSAENTLTITVKANPATVNGVDDHGTTKQDTPITMDVLSNDESAPGKVKADTLKLYGEDGKEATSVAVKGGVYTITNGEVVFTPEKGFYGEAGTVTYGATTEDGLEYKAKAGVSVTKVEVPVDPTPTPTPTPDPTPTTPDSTPTPDKPVTPGPVIQTDMAGDSGASSTGAIAGLGVLAGATGLGALRRKRR